MNVLRLRLPLLVWILTSMLSCQQGGGDVASSRDARITAKAREIGIGSSHKRSYRTLLHEPKSLGLHFPGYLVSFEKAASGRIATEFTEESREFDNHIHRRATVFHRRFGDRDTIYKEIAKATGSPARRPFLSHIVKHERGQPSDPIVKTLVYSAYGPESKGPKNSGQIYSQSTVAMRELEKSVVQEARDRNATDIFVYSMGWNTNQKEALKNYNDLFGHFLQQCERDPQMRHIRPLFIGLTWDSGWVTPSGRRNPLSFWTKKSDADVIGGLWANVIVNHIALRIKERRPSTRVFLVGHSFGGRLLLTSLFSRHLLPDSFKPAPEHVRVDATLLLQAAANVGRLTRRPDTVPIFNAAETSTKIVCTWSGEDLYNELALWTNNIGGFNGWSKAWASDCALSKAEEKEVFQFFKIQKTGANTLRTDPPLAALDRVQRRVLYGDATEVIKGHSDIYTPEVGAMLKHLVKSTVPHSGPKAGASR